MISVYNIAVIRCIKRNTQYRIKNYLHTLKNRKEYRFIVEMREPISYYHMDELEVMNNNL